jgi:hypothetical protein
MNKLFLALYLCLFTPVAQASECPAGSAVIRLDMEFRRDFFAWDHERTWPAMCVTNGLYPAQIRIRFKDEPYQSMISIYGNDQGGTWKFRVTRENSANGQPISSSQVGPFDLGPGDSHRFRMETLYLGQERDLRFTVKLRK